jgi:hypothetical protein
MRTVATACTLAVSLTAIACATVSGLDKLHSGDGCADGCRDAGDLAADAPYDHTTIDAYVSPPAEAAMIDETPPDVPELDGNGAGDAGDSSDGTLADVSLADAPSDAPPPLVVRLNIDGNDHAGVDYPGQWSASPVPKVCGPYNFETGRAIHGTNDAPLFVGEANGNPMTCTIGAATTGVPLPPGTYRVRLYFAEVYWGPGCEKEGGVNTRVFDIALEGKTVLQNFDIFKESGGCVASTSSDSGVPVVKTFEIAVNDGILDISMPATHDRAKISALEVFGPL